MQVEGRWQVKSEGLMPLHAQAVSLLGGLAQYTIQHICRCCCSAFSAPVIQMKGNFGAFCSAWCLTHH